MKPTIMISSTYSDLKDIRHVLHDFITNDLGYDCLISEHHDFPVNSLNSAVDNCRNAVKKDTDILVLIIGQRFGSIDSESGQSVTSIEYFEARQKKIPIIAFIAKQVLAYHDVWKTNPSTSFEGLVDSAALFDLIDTVYTKDKIWTYKFDNLDEIIAPIRSQLSNMFAELLLSDRTIQQTRVSNLASLISAEALKIILSKDTGWEFFFFFQMWRDEISKYEDQYYKYIHGLYYGIGSFIPDEHVKNWLHSKTDEILRFTHSADHIINESIDKALGEPGTPSDLNEVVKVSERIGSLYAFLLSWSHNVSSSSLPSPYDELIPFLAKIPASIIDEFRSFPDKCDQMTRDAIEELGTDAEGTKVINATMAFELHEFDEFMQKMEELGLKYS